MFSCQTEAFTDFMVGFLLEIRRQQNHINTTPKATIRNAERGISPGTGTVNQKDVEIMMFFTFLEGLFSVRGKADTGKFLGLRALGFLGYMLHFCLY